MANKTVYPYGTGGQLPSSIGIVNDLETGGIDKALSAQQGVVLKEMIESGSSSGENLGGKIIPLPPLAGVRGNYINVTSNQWKSSTATKSFFVPVTPGGSYGIVGGTSNGRYAILASNTQTVDTTPDYATGETGVHTVPAGTEVKFTVPDDGHYLSINYTLSDNNVCPKELIEYVPESELLEEPLNELRGEFDEKVDFETLTVLSNDTSKITITKDNDGGIMVINSTSTSGKYALIAFPDNLEHGKKYRMSFKYQATFNKAETWYMRPVSSSYAETSNYGIYLRVAYEPTYVVLDFTYNYADAYMRLASTSQNNGARVYITEFSISENKTTVAELSAKVNQLGDSSSSDGIDVLLQQAQYVSSSVTTEPLTLMHFTDIHGDTSAALAIKSFFDKHSSVIDDMVQTGDAVYYYWDDSKGYQWYQQYGNPEALFVLGNHDGAANSNAQGWKEDSADWDFKGKEWDFDTYFANYIETRGITPPTGYDDSTSPYYKACYWHKDYSSAKIRVIGLDCMHFNDGVRYTSNDQETWLAAKLQETLTSGNAAYGFSVVFLCHYALDDYNGANEEWDDETHRFVFNQNANGGHVMDLCTNQPVNCHYGTSYSADKRFSMRNRVGEVGSPSYTKGTENPIADVIQTWMNSGGKYLAWLSGHTHTEYMYYPKKYPNMLVIGLPQAGNGRGNSAADRSDSSPMHACANIIVFDTQNSKIKIVRFGKTLDKNLMRFEKLCYDYSTKNTMR